MDTRNKKEKRRFRLSGDQTRKNADRKSGSGGDFLILPKGISRWTPQKPEKYILDIVPYEVTKKTNPDDGVKPGAIHWRRKFVVHRNLGPDSKSVVCPRENGERCPKCDLVDELRKEWDDNEEVIKTLWKDDQRLVVYNILNPDDDSGVVLLCLSYGKLDKHIENELKEDENDELTGFYDVTEDGKSLKVRFSKKTFNGNEYLEATKIDFIDRDEMDEDEILDLTVDLDSILNAATTEDMEDMFDEEEYTEDTESKKRKKKSRQPEPEEEEDEEEDDWDDE